SAAPPKRRSTWSSKHAFSPCPNWPISASQSPPPTGKPSTPPTASTTAPPLTPPATTTSASTSAPKTPLTADTQTTTAATVSTPAAPPPKTAADTEYDAKHPASQCCPATHHQTATASHRKPNHNAASAQYLM